MMKINKLLLMLASLPALWGCASFNSGDMLVERNTARAMLEEKNLTPFAEIEISWRNFPYRAATDSIGEGSISNPKKIKPVPVAPEDAADFARKAKEVFAEAGLYNREHGSGKLRLELTSFGRWTYRELFHSFLVDTGFIFLIPASLRVNYYLTADFAVPGGPMRVETQAQNKTTFHLLLAPLYPFFSPGAKESRLLKQMLWRSATDVYSSLKAAGAAPIQLPPRAQQPDNAPAAIPAPPLQPDRSWLPEKTEGTTPEDLPAIIPEKPAQSWTVKPPPASQPAGTKAPQEQEMPDRGWTAPAVQLATPTDTPAARQSFAAPGDDEESGDFPSTVVEPEETPDD